MNDDLDIVCNDALDSTWKHDTSNNTYYRVYPDNTYTRIKGEYLPDPDRLLNNKIKLYKKKGERVNIDALKPSNAIYALWEHQKGVRNA